MHNGDQRKRNVESSGTVEPQLFKPTERHTIGADKQGVCIGEMGSS